MHRRWWLVLALCNAHAMAQGVHKCVATGGAVTYQDTPCEHAREAANWQAPVDPTPSPPRAPASRPERATEPRARTSRAHLVRTAPKPSACDVAKANRDSTLERVGLKRTFDLLSQLDEQVRKACR